MSKAALLAAVVPVAAATAAVLTFSAMELTGATPLSFGRMHNLAEAAGLGDAPEVLRLLSAGADPNRVVTVRREIISSRITRVTALEAAIWSRRAQLIHLLDRQGAIVDDETRRHLTCLANDLPVEEIVKYLSPNGPPDCTPGRELEIVLQRSREESR